MNSLASAQPSGSTLPPSMSWGRALRLMLLCGLVLVVLGLFVRLLWGAQSNSRLDRAVAAIEAAGEPIHLKDLNPDPVFEGDNIAAVLMEAAALPEIDRDDPIWNEPYRVTTAEEAETHAAVIDPWRSAMALARTARSRTGVDWGVEYTSPAIEILLPQLQPQRDLCKLQGRAAALDIYRGDHASAVEALRDMVFAADALEQMPVLIGHLVAAAQASVVCDVIENNAARLEVDGPDERAAVDALIGALYDETEARAGIVRAMYGERAFILDSTILLSEGRMPIAAFGTGTWQIGSPSAAARARGMFLGPLIRSDGVRCLAIVTQIVQAVQAADYPTAADKMPNINQVYAQASMLDKLAAVPSLILLPALDRAVMLQYNYLAKRRMAVTALAIRLHELDHGARPATLQALVPAYLPAVPQDPFTADGSLLHYVSDDDTPRLYSLGPDGVDDDGAVAHEARNGQGRLGDVILYLDGRPEE